MCYFFVFLALFPLSGWAANLSQPIVAPKVVKFADMQLKLTTGARKRVQVKIDQLTKWERIFNATLDRTNLFFPLIEKTLAEENVPEDFKFQALHESMLVGDAVSHTNDVGFWQIHKVAAKELKLSIDHPVDERMHLIQSTKAAARFLKGHNKYFDSWLGALLAYNRGRAGAIKLFPKKYRGAKVIQLDEQTDQYLLSVIATKLAFEKMAGKQKHSKLQLFVCDYGHHGHKLNDIALHLQVAEKLLSEHNLWLRTAIIPSDTSCSLVVPFSHSHPAIPSLSVLKMPKLPICAKDIKVVVKQSKQIIKQPKQIAKRHNIDYERYLKSPATFPQITSINDLHVARFIKANGILAVVAKKGDTIAHLAQLGNLSIDKFLLINEIKEIDELIPGFLYYYNTKRNKGGAHYHVVLLGEDVRHIAQQYGIKQAAILEKNRMKPEDRLEEGRILWLRFIRPHKIPVAYK